MEEQFYNEAKQYLEGTLSPEQASAFEASLQGNPDLMLDFNLYKGLWLAKKKSIQEKALEDTLMARGQELLQNPDLPESDPDLIWDEAPAPAKRVSMWSGARGRVAVAAGLALLVAAIWFVIRPPLEPTAQVLKENYERAESGTLLGGGPDRLSKIYERYAAKDFEGAIAMIEQEPADSIYQSRIWYLKGASQYESGAFEGAVTSFGQVDGASILYPAAQKNIALAYLALQKPDAAKRQLNAMLGDNQIPDKDAVRNLLERIERLKSNR